MNHPSDDRKGFFGSRSGMAFLVLAAIAAFFLLSEHRAHAFGALPFLLLLACPLMHLFMHGGHGHGRESDPRRGQDQDGDRNRASGRPKDDEAAAHRH